MNEPILITYASRSGSTAEIAAPIASTLQQEKTPVAILSMGDVKQLSCYPAVIISSPIRKSQWLPEALRFVQDHQADLTRKRVAVFTLSIMLAMSNSSVFLSPILKFSLLDLYIAVVSFGL